MKNLKSKVLALALSIALLVCGIIAITASAETASDTPTVAIKMKNVSFTSSPTLAFAVEHTNCDAADLTMTVINVNDENDHFTVKSNETVTISGTTYPVFYLNGGIDPKNVAEEYLVYVSVDDTEVKSDVVRYSILQFALEGMLTTTDAAEYARYESIVTYAKSIQEWLAPDGKFTGTPADEYFYIKATDAKDVASGIYSGAQEITLEYDTTSLNAEAITGWKLTTNEGGVKSSTVVPNGATVTISESTEITPTFAPVETFDNGLGSYVYNISSASRVYVQNGELVMSTDNGAQDYFRIKFMNDAAYKTYIFQSDIYVDFDYTDDDDVGAEDNLTFNFRNASNSTFMAFTINNGDTDGTVKISLPNADGSESGTTSYMVAPLTNNIFNLKVEYYYLDTYAVAKFYINGALAGIRNVASAEVLDFIQPTTTTASEFLAKFDNVSLYKSDKAYVYQTPGIYESFEDGATANVGSGTSAKNNTAVNIETVTGADGESTKAFVVNKTASGNYYTNVRCTNRGANTTLVYQADMKLTISSGDLVFVLGNTGIDGDYAYRLHLRYSNGVIQVNDRTTSSSTNKGASVNTTAVKEEWFNIRIEYTEISDTEILAVTYINGEIVYVSDSCATLTNNYDDVTWPVFGGSGVHTSSNNNSWGTIDTVRIYNGTSAATFTLMLDNVLCQTIPTPDYDFAESDYTNRVHAPAN